MLIEELRAAVRARDDFLSIAAHELRNPMHALALQASSALRAAHKHGHPDLVQRLERVVLAINRYVQRANLLLDISRINAGRLHLTCEEIDLAQIVRDAVVSYEAEAEHHGVVFNLDIPETVLLRGDRVALEQIAANLVSNAIKYGNGAPVDLRLARTPHRSVELVVKDHGVGISEADQKRIFDRFEQIMTGQPRAGFGIGLWLVRSLVEAHQGAITVESTLHQGSTFTVRLPLDTNSFHADQ